MPQQYLGSDYLQPTSFLSNSLQTSNNQVQFHSGGIISLHDTLCAGQARYTDLVFVKRCGQQWILEVTQQYLLELPGIDRVSVVRILFTFSETGSITYDLQALFISVQSGQVHSLSDFLAVCDIISKEGGYKYCPGIDVKHYYDHYHSIIRYHIKSVRSWDLPFKRIDSINCSIWHQLARNATAVVKSSDMVLCKPCKRLQSDLDHQRRRSQVSPLRRASRQLPSSSFKLKYLRITNKFSQTKASNTDGKVI